MLAAHAVTVGYGRVPIVRDVSLALRPGEVVCLLGPNGGGKTTLFKTLLGLLAPLAGTISLDGEDVARWPRRRFARMVGYVPQAHAALFPFSVREVVLMGRAPLLGLFAVPGAADRAITERALASVGIAHLADRIYTECSGGERQLALIARALAQDAQVLVLDEPTASLDFGNQLRVLAKVRDLAASGRAVVLSTHDPDHTFLCGDRVLLLHGGTLLADGPPASVVTSASLEHLYGVAVEVMTTADGRRICVPSLTRQAAMERTS